MNRLAPVPHEGGYLVIPEPEDAFPVSSDAIQTITEIVDALQDSRVIDGYYPLSLNTCYSEALHTVVETTPDLFGQVTDYLGAGSVAVTVETTPVIPHRPQRSPIWHIDRTRSTQGALAVATGLPTEFASGKIPDSNPLANTLFPEETYMPGRRLDIDAVGDALRQGYLKIIPSKEAVATYFETNLHIHRSGRNETNRIVNRFFMRFIAVDPTE